MEPRLYTQNMMRDNLISVCLRFIFLFALNKMQLISQAE